MKYEEEVDPVRITRGMRDEVEALGSTADMIEVLVSEAQVTLTELQQFYQRNAAEPLPRDWHVVMTFLRLAERQADIVKETADRFQVGGFRRAA